MIWLLVLTISTMFISECRGNLMETQQPPKYVIVGLISKCEGENAMGKKISDILNKQMRLFQYRYQYLEFDVCEDQEKLIQTLVDLTLSPQWNINNSSNYWIKGVFSYLRDDLLEIALTFLAFTDIKVYSLTKTTTKPVWFENQKNLSPMYHSQKVTEPIIAQLLGRSKWTNILIVEMFRSSSSVKINNLIQSLPKIHIRYFAIQGYTNDEEVFKKIERDKNLQVVVVVSPLAAKFLMDAVNFKVRHVYWVLFANYKGSFTNMPEFICFRGVIGNYEIYPNYHNDTKCSHEFIASQKKKDKSKLIAQCGGKVTKNVSNRVNHFNTLEKITKLRIFNSVVEIKGDSKIQDNIYQSLGGGKTVTFRLISHMKETAFIYKSIDNMKNFKIKEMVPFCKNVVIQRFKNPQGNLSIQIDYFCRTCQAEYVRRGRACSRCSSGMIPMKNQTGCYNPFRKVKVYAIVYALNGIGIALCLLILCVFFKFRSTPVARASHFLLSVTQIVCCLMLFVLLIAGVRLPSTELVCTGRQVLVSLTLVVIDGIVVCKAEQIITICSIKTLIDRKTKRDLLVKQMLIFAFIVLFDLIVIVSCFPIPSVLIYKEVATDVNGNKFYKSFCDFGEKSWLQVIYCIFILLLSIVQALRGHNRLPDAYNEGNAIITSSATSACCLLFLSIYSSSSNEGLYQEDFISVVCISLSISLIILLICLYAGKIYIMLFRKSRNTKSFIKTYTKTLEYAAIYFDNRRNRTRIGVASVTSITYMQSGSGNGSPLL